MLLVRGSTEGTTLTGTLYERGDDPPSFRGAPDGDAPFVWVCDEFYAVESGGLVQRVAGEDVNIAFESPLPRGFDTLDRALEGAKDHVRTQFARIGVGPDAVEIAVIRDPPEASHQSVRPDDRSDVDGPPDDSAEG